MARIAGSRDPEGVDMVGMGAQLSLGPVHGEVSKTSSTPDAGVTGAAMIPIHHRPQRVSLAG